MVTEIATPTIIPAFAEVKESSPAMPARKATTNEVASGCQMNEVLGRAASNSSRVNSPRPSITRVNRTVDAIATANPVTSAFSERSAGRARRCTSATQSPASGPNSGPTAMAPTTRIALSSTAPQAASIVATARKAR